MNEAVNEVCVQDKEQHSKCKILKTILIIFAAYAAIIGVIKLIKTCKAKKREAQNDQQDIKEYYSYFDGRDIKLERFSFTGIILKNVMGAMNVNMSDVIVKNDSFISAECYMGALSIIIPKNVNVKIDGIIKGCNVENDIPEYSDEDIPTLYVALKAYGSSVKIKQAE